MHCTFEVLQRSSQNKTNIMSITKTEIKRIERDTRDISFKLEMYLQEFKNTYLSDFVNFRRSELQAKFDYNNNLATNPKALEEFNQLGLKNSVRPQWFSPLDHSSFEIKAKKIKKQLDLSSLRQLDWLNEADKNYKIKFNKLVSRLVEYKVSAYRMKLVFIDDNNNKEFSFMITDHLERVIHARVIYACGMIKAPHYRFIVTERKTK